MRGKIDEIEKIIGPKRPKLPQFGPGDTVLVEYVVREGGRERTLQIEGTVISMRGAGNSETFTMRALVQGEGVERVIPLSSPNLLKISVKRKGKVRRAKLYYLRTAKGKRARIEEIFVSKKDEEKRAESKEAQKPSQPPAEQAKSEKTEAKK